VGDAAEGAGDADGDADTTPPAQRDRTLVMSTTPLPGRRLSDTPTVEKVRDPAAHLASRGMWGQASGEGEGTRSAG
jgi:hypothetical protein